MWRFAENDDRESFDFKTDELLVGEATARASKWYIDSGPSNDRRCTNPKGDAKKANKTKLVMWCQMLSTPMNAR